MGNEKNKRFMFKEISLVLSLIMLISIFGPAFSYCKVYADERNQIKDMNTNEKQKIIENDNTREIKIKKNENIFKEVKEKENIEEKNNQIVVDTTTGTSITLSIPDNIIMESTTSSSITITWDEVENADGYEIEADGEIIDNNKSTSYTHSDLEPSTEHKFRVRAKNEELFSEWSEAETCITLEEAKPMLSIPSNIILESTTSSSITVTWDEVENADGYEIEADGKIIGNNSTSYIHSNLFPSSEHRYRVRAKNEELFSEWSEIETCITLEEAKPMLSIPSNIILESTTSSSITVTWDEVENADGYEIEADGEIIGNNSTSYTHSDLAPSSEHKYRVRAKNEELFSEWSEAETCITLEEAKPMLSIPSNIILESTTSSSITVTWDEVENADGYEIEADGEIIDNNKSTSYTHSDLAPSSEHKYRVRAKSNEILSEWSEFLTFTTLDKLDVPENIKTIATSDSIVITWDEVEGAKGYDVEVDGEVIDVNQEVINEIEELCDLKYYFIYSNEKYKTVIFANVPFKFNSNNNLYIESDEKTKVYVKRFRYRGDWSVDWDELGSITRVTIDGKEYAQYNSNRSDFDWASIEGLSAALEYTNHNICDEYGITVFHSDKTKYVQSNLSQLSECTFRVRSKKGDLVGEWSEVIKELTLEKLEDTIIESNLTLDEDKVYGNLHLKSGVLNLNGHTLTVKGDLIQKGGTVELNDGKLYVIRDYQITGNSNLIMLKEKDYLFVEGSFKTESIRPHWDSLKAGTLEVKGDFTQKSPDNTNPNRNFDTSGTHKVILSGEKVQKVSFSNPGNSGFVKLEINNTSEEGVIFSTPIYFRDIIDNAKHNEIIYNGYFELNSDKVINSKITVIDGTIKLNGHRLAVKGDLIITGNSNLIMLKEKDYLFVEGSFKTESIC